VSFTVDTEFTPLGAETSEAAVSPRISDGDLRRLHELAIVAGVG
jgi:hypothetical protein